MRTRQLLQHGCPVCGGAVEDAWVLERGVCPECGVKGRSPFQKEKNVFKSLAAFFEEKVGRKPWSLQKFWLARIALGDSFAILAPPGLGKTTFGLVVASWFARTGKSYVVLPTQALVKQACGVLSSWGQDYLSYISSEKNSDVKKRIEEGDFNLLVTTSNFLLRNFDLLHGKFFDFIFVDDVDAIFKASAGVEKVIQLAGVPREVIPRAYGKNFEWSGKTGIVVLSSATARARGKKPILFERFFGFYPAGTIVPVRKIEDFYDKLSIEKLEEVLERLGPGGLVFFQRGSREDMEKVVHKLSFKFKIKVFEQLSDLEDFKQGRIDFLAQTASVYGKLVRGIDLPERIRYVVFFGVPHLSYRADNPASVFQFLSLVERVFKDERVSKVLDKMAKSPGEVPPEAIELVEEYVKPEALEKLRSLRKVSLEKVNGEVIVKVPDVATYIQASGRASRMWKGGITFGVSVVLVDDEVLFDSLVNSLKVRFGSEIEFLPWSQANTEALVQKIDRSRKVPEDKPLDIKTSLLIVESPTKAKTIARFFGKPTVKTYKGVRTYEVFTGDRILNITASKGHVLDLVPSSQVDGEIYGVLKKGDNFVGVFDYIVKCPACGKQYVGVDRCPCGGEVVSQRDVIEAIRRISFTVDEIFLTTDPDREGEKISYDLRTCLAGFSGSVYRMEMHEITRPEFFKAISNLREIDFNRVDAQLVRRYEDRWIGFYLSGVLQKKFGKPGLSAGRVQSPVLGWIIDRYEQSRKRIRRVFFEIAGQRLSLDEREHPWVKDVKKLEQIFVEKIEHKAVEKAPPPPFTTHTLLVAAARLGFSVNKTMQLAQDLFSSGLITYHRTDSSYVSEVGRNIARDYLQMTGQIELFFPRAWGQPGTHEAIRPTRPLDTKQLVSMIRRGQVSLVIKLSGDHLRLYNLIFQRFIQSQMRNVELRVQFIKALAENNSFYFERPVEIIKKGFAQNIKVYPPLTSGKVDIKNFSSRSLPVVLPFTQGELIDMMKEKEIGRPSTYARTVNVILQRRFAVEKNRRLIPTALGRDVYSFLVSEFPDLISEERTRDMEKRLDMIENGSVSFEEAMRSLFEEMKRYLRASEQR